MIVSIYHFCAFRQGQYPGELIYRSGTVSADMDLSKPENYKRLQKAIGDGFDPPAIEGQGVIILSLSKIE